MKWGLSAAGLAVLLLSSAVFGLRAPLFTDNFHTVIPGEVYRSGQLDPTTLEARIRELGLRSIVNLRTANAREDGGDSYREERTLATARGVAHYGVELSALRLPSPGKLSELLDVLDRAERPLLIHCRNGTDRTGLASALVLLLDGARLDHAREEFGLRHGHLFGLSPSDLSGWLDVYGGWLRAQGAKSSAVSVHEFSHSGYTPYFYDARIEPVSLPDRIEAQRSQGLVFRVTNQSPLAWTFTSPSPRGVHLGLRVRSLDPERAYELELRGATPDLLFQPGDSIELSATLPALPSVGRYRVSVDLVDEYVAWFAQMGSTPFEFVVDAQAARVPAPVATDRL